MQEIGIQSDSLEQIRAGRKTIEGRLATARFLTFRVGDMIWVREDIWENGKIVASRPNAAIVLITNIERFDTFREMLTKLGYERFRPNDENLEAALKTYARYYSAQDERKYGVLALSFLIKSAD